MSEDKELLPPEWWTPFNQCPEEWRTAAKTAEREYNRLAARPREAEGALRPYLKCCPWCGADQSDMSNPRQVDHLVSCGDARIDGARREGFRAGMEQAAVIADSAPSRDGPLHILFDGPPGPEAGRFVEVEDDRGMSVRVGRWEQRGDYWHLILSEPVPDENLRETVKRMAAEMRELTDRLDRLYHSPLLRDALGRDELDPPEPKPR